MDASQIVVYQKAKTKIILILNNYKSLPGIWNWSLFNYLQQHSQKQREQWQIIKEPIIIFYGLKFDAVNKYNCKGKKQFRS